MSIRQRGDDHIVHPVYLFMYVINYLIRQKKLSLYGVCDDAINSPNTKYRVVLFKSSKLIFSIGFFSKQKY